MDVPGIFKKHRVFLSSWSSGQYGEIIFVMAGGDVAAIRRSPLVGHGSSSQPQDGLAAMR